MKFSVIVPSFNQDRFIAQTLHNLIRIQQIALQNSCGLEILVFDSVSNSKVQAILEQFKDSINYLEIKKDEGQFDAINKGILKVKGDFWTWLNTDDLLDEKGFEKVIQHLKVHPDTDYIYGSIQYMDAESKAGKVVKAWPLNLSELVSSKPSIFQPGSWFRKEFTDHVGLLSNYQCCFDYEYICRLLQQQAKVFCVESIVAQFRYYSDSKSGSIMKKFVQEQWNISKQFGRKWKDSLTWTLALRKLKHFVVS